MKNFKFLLSLLILAAITSCTKEDTTSSAPNAGSDSDARLEITISTASSTYTKADGIGEDATVTDGDTVEGSTDESKVNTVTLIVFDASHNYLTYRYLGSNDLSNGVYKCDVPSSAYYFFAVVNATSTIQSTIESFTGGYGDVSIALNEPMAAAASAFTSASTGFVMSSAGSFTADGDDALTTPTDAYGNSISQLATGGDDVNYIRINVDRIVAKFQYSASPLTVASPAAASIIGVRLNATNKKSAMYTPILTNTLTGNNVYREDHNMNVSNEVTVAGLEAEFNWLKNNTAENYEASFSVSPYALANADIAEYVLENTANQSHYDYNNLTQAVVKAKYTPDATNIATVNDSWFVINILGTGDVYMTFDDVVAFYNGTGTYARSAASTDTKNAMDRQLNWILAGDVNATTYTWANNPESKTQATLTLLDAVANGGYKAATVPDTDGTNNYVVEYYQNSINYYDVFIQHDSAREPYTLGRWGMVRNNSYTMVISSISGRGLPYIPDPTDLAITDPDNPDPTDPEPADALDAAIEATITVNNWVTWSQSVDLQ